ncbi:penicillin-binding transpeptidase domain-containing protein [Thioalkalivibrio sp. XN8]|uniref:peptidoglycan D,D-transpeptidase FtsI family protein n=1 Tax=Thioalkalivibrio sp. XN8 TaxID=2712863 RepID=UPI0013EC0E35|nr:penicillin-binding transpeptidase domain-containing protein [Thioalkalivibrio sp. XN8]NGP52181.1 penicillin-binding protein 2 [Thioalkalivibrio sp. XN8]
MKRRIDQDLFERRFRRRMLFVAASFALLGMLLGGRAVKLQFVDQAFFARQGDARQMREVDIAAHRGTITDRRGEPLAVSSPVDSVWANPAELRNARDRIPELAQRVGREPEWILRAISSQPEREFLYLRRHLPPEQAAAVMELGIPGVHLQREYRRFYPTGEVTGHLLGFTNIDDAGQEGLELAYDHWLAGQPGRKRVRRDRLGNIIEDVASIREARPGRDLRLSIDLRIQYLAYRELKRAVQAHQARSGSMVILDVRTGEVLAMVNQPNFNPNDRGQLQAERYRNRATNDIFEPGSSIKPLIIAAALSSGKFAVDAEIDTAPGWLTIGTKTIEDRDNLGRIDFATLLLRSSNVGASKVALALEPRQLWSELRRFGLGEVSATGFPGESAGVLMEPELWRPIGQATLAYGYGLSVTPLQLAHAYAVLGADGRAAPVSMLALNRPAQLQQVIEPAVARAVLEMMQPVVSAEGTAPRAAIPGYRVAGKTGTARKFTSGGYHDDRYLSVFGGIAPASEPQLAAVVMIDEPSTGVYYGGEVAAPVFARVLGDALRILGIPPDDGAGARSAGTLVQAAGQP